LRYFKLNSGSTERYWLYETNTELRVKSGFFKLGLKISKYPHDNNRLINNIACNLYKGILIELTREEFFIEIL